MWVKIPPNFSFAWVGSRTTDCPRTSHIHVLSCVAKKRSIGWDGAWREEKRREGERKREKIYAGGCAGGRDSPPAGSDWRGCGLRCRCSIALSRQQVGLGDE